AKEVQHPDGRVVVEEGGKALGFHLIIDGEAEVDNPDKSILKAGDYFGEISLIDGLPRSVSVTAKRGMRTVYLNSSTFDALLRDYPETARSVMKVLTKRIRDLESKARAQSA
ncbi:MAG TPA: cyclic nucleotide-binding domain-containing protein, partial [Jatrophihabitans sp.]|nr:cyclic nucleotide-binding domain-containing protein [Jatrophihabitans sp.]